MAFAILRIQKITANKVGGANAHNTRTMEVPNADNELREYNSQLKGTNNLKNDIDNRLKDAGIDKTRSNAVLGIEHMMTASPEFFNYKKNEKGELTGNVKDWNKFEKECLNWLNKEYGEENVINVHVHKDEKNPHLHAIVTPILEKEIQWKNGNEKGSKIENRLSARDFVNGANKLRKMQDSFAQHIQKSGLELQRGEKGSKATHTEIKKFYSHIQKANDFKTQKTEINIKAPKIEISKPPLFGNFEKYKTNTEQEIQQQVNSVQEDTHKSVLEALEPLHSINTLLLEESRLKTKLDSENKELRRLLLNSKQEIQKLKERNTEIKDAWKNEKIYLEGEVSGFKSQYQKEKTTRQDREISINYLHKEIVKSALTPIKPERIEILKESIRKNKNYFDKLQEQRNKIKEEEKSKQIKQQEKTKKQAENPKKEEKTDLKEKVTTGEKKKEESKKNVEKYTSIKKSKSRDQGPSM